MVYRHRVLNTAMFTSVDSITSVLDEASALGWEFVTALPTGHILLRRDASISDEGNKDAKTDS